MLSFARRHAALAAVWLIPSLAVSACYRTLPVREAPRPDAEIVVEMTPEATDRLGGFLGRGTVSARGRLLAWAPDTIVVAMHATEDARGEEQLWRRERVSIPRDAVARVTERRLQRGRTALLVVGGTLFIVTAVVLATEGQGGTSGGGTKPVPQ